MNLKNILTYHKKGAYNEEVNLVRDSFWKQMRKNGDINDMKKAATIILWLSLGMGLVNVIVTVIAALAGGALSPVPTTNNSVYIIGILYHIVKTGLPLIGMLMFVLIILFTMKSKSEKIVAEILALIIFAGGGVLVNTVLSYFLNTMIAKMGSMALASYSYMNSGAHWVSFLGNISLTLFIVGVSFAIAHKKVELADLRRLMEEEQV